MKNEARKEKPKFTYQDYLNWPDEERWEIINGEAYAMSPGPSRQHQEISGNIFFAFKNHLKDGMCKIYAAPFDVRLPQKNEQGKTVSTVVQPDISIICDPNKLDDKGCQGSPDLIIEILSPASSKNDLIIKRKLYEEHAVREYWIADPVNCIISRFCYDLNTDQYEQVEYFSSEDTINPRIFPELEIKLEELFYKEELPVTS